LLNILLNPVQAIQQAKTEKSLVKSIIVALLAGIVSAIAGIVTTLPVLALASKSVDPTNVIIGAVIGFAIGVLTVLILTIVSGFLTSKVMSVLGGTGGFFEGLTVSAYSGIISAVGVLILTIFSSISTQITKSGFISLQVSGLLGMLVLLIGLVIAIIILAISIATAYKAMKELFSTDYITVIVAMTVMFTAAIIVMYLLVITSIMGMVGSIGSTMGAVGML